MPQENSDEKRLTEYVRTFGSEAVTRIRRMVDPSFELPAHLQGIRPGRLIGHATWAEEFGWKD